MCACAYFTLAMLRTSARDTRITRYGKQLIALVCCARHGLVRASGTRFTASECEHIRCHRRLQGMSGIPRAGLDNAVAVLYAA